MYKVTQSSQQSLPGYSCPAGHGVFTVITPPRTTMWMACPWTPSREHILDVHGLSNAVLPCRICYVVPQSWGVQLITKNDEGVKWNRPILHWPLTHYYRLQRACFMQISRIILKVMTKSWGDQYIAGPPTKKLGGGDLSPPVPMIVAPMMSTSSLCCEE